MLVALFLTYAIGQAQTYVKLQKGETYSMAIRSVSGSEVIYEGLGPHLAYSKTSTLSTGFKIYAVSRGTGFAINTSGGAVIFTVLDVINIDIPEKVEVKLGEQYTYFPIVTDAEAKTTLTWASNNTSVANVDANGVVTTVGLGQATITCTASNGVKAQSLVEVVPMLAQSVTLNTNSCELSVGEKVQLQTTIQPANVTSSEVVWISGNENIAQVDNGGLVTAIGPGYCSIYVKANDGSGKFDRCLVHVPETTKKGDVNGDGNVNLSDAKMVVDIFVGKE